MGARYLSQFVIMPRNLSAPARIGATVKPSLRAVKAIETPGVAAR
jgi:hypothetical protein